MDKNPCSPTDRERIAALEARADAMQTAVEKAESALAARLEGMNEIREAMRDQTSKLVTRMELYWAFAALLGVCSLLVTVMVNR